MEQLINNLDNKLTYAYNNKEIFVPNDSLNKQRLNFLGKGVVVVENGDIDSFMKLRKKMSIKKVRRVKTGLRMVKGNARGMTITGANEYLYIIYLNKTHKNKSFKEMGITEGKGGKLNFKNQNIIIKDSKTNKVIAKTDCPINLREDKKLELKEVRERGINKKTTRLKALIGEIVFDKRLIEKQNNVFYVDGGTVNYDGKVMNIIASIVHISNNKVNLIKERDRDGFNKTSTSAEILSATIALERIEALGLKKATIAYDCLLIQKALEPGYKSKVAETNNYINLYNKLKDSGVKITFKKVVAHSDNIFNSLADNYTYYEHKKKNEMVVRPS